MPEPRFCLHCGAALEMRPIDGEPRPACPACPYVCFDNPVAVAGVIVRRGEEVLLVRQPDFPQFVLVAGYLEAYESAEDAAVREMKEETGLDVVVERVLGLGSTSCGAVGKYVGRVSGRAKRPLPPSAGRGIGGRRPRAVRPPRRRGS